jgi:hypothetical protein
MRQSQRDRDSEKVELCFFDSDSYLQIRVRGTAVLDDSDELKNEILALPQRAFLNEQADRIGREKFLSMLLVFRISHADAIVWTLKSNFEPNKLVPLYS